MNDDILVELKKISSELKKVSSYLALLSLNPGSELISILKNIGILTTKRRVEMFLLINGSRTTSEIAKKVGISERGAQLFIKELADKQIITVEKKGNAFIPVKNYAKIIEIVQTTKGSEKHE